MVEKEYQKWLNGDMSQRGWLQVAERCLAKEHAAMVRLVKQVKGADVPGMEDFNEALGYDRACHAMLAALARRKAGR